MSRPKTFSLGVSLELFQVWFEKCLIGQEQFNLTRCIFRKVRFGLKSLDLFGFELELAKVNNVCSIF